MFSFSQFLTEDLLLEAKVVKDFRTSDKLRYYVFWAGQYFILVDAPNDRTYTQYSLPAPVKTPRDRTTLVAEDTPENRHLALIQKFFTDNNIDHRKVIAVVLVDDGTHTINLTDDMEFLSLKNRRGHNTREASYIIPSGDDAFRGNRNNLRKFLVSLVQYDKKYLAFRTHSKSNFDNLVVADVIREHPKDTAHTQKIVASTTGSLKLYHGTSQVAWNEIKTKGLLPGQTRKEYSDLIKGYSDQNIYLSLDLHDAQNYATRAAIWDRSLAVVLEVEITDFTKFRPDEDTMGHINYHFEHDQNAKSYLQSIYDGLEKLGRPRTIDVEEGDWVEGKFVEKTVTYDNTQFHPKDLARKHPEQFALVMKYYMTQLTRGFGKSQAIAYRGRIPASKIKLVMSYKPAKMDMYPSDAEFMDAYDKTRASIKYPKGKKDK